MIRSLEVDGFAVIEQVLGQVQIANLIEHIELNLRPAEQRGGLRNLLDDTCMQALVNTPALRMLAEQVLGPDCFAVRGILFDKTPGANWKVPWHQDVTIAVRERVDTTGYGPWSIKAGVAHVQPPAEVLERMLTVRLHLDNCPAENGALRVLPSTHCDGKLAETDIARLAQVNVSVPCEVRAGGALLMRPLLVHASSAATVPGHRRVLHFDFAQGDLAMGLEWAERRNVH